jgi:2-iminobutanoate/2-iminopropanoate deaminase
MTHIAIKTADAPAAVGPYSPAVAFDGGKLLFVSGQIAIDPATGRILNGTAAEQTEQVLRNLRALLEAGGSGMDRVLKTTVFLLDMNDFGAMNDVYAQHFPGVKPARSTVEVRRLPKDVRVEIEAIAAL